MLPSLSRILLIIGIIFLVLAGLVYLAGRINLPLGKLPGDLTIQGKNLTCFIPLATMLLLSIVISVIINIITRLLGPK